MSHSPLDHPGWLEIAVDIDPIAHEAVSSFLFNLGCEGVVSEELTKVSILKAYLSLENDAEKARLEVDHFLSTLRDIFPETKPYQLTFKNIRENDWDLSWRKFFRPDQITQKLMVIPAWESIPESSPEHIIVMDPGPAFGTGQHPTTRMCLEALETVLFDVSWSLLDVGTGSGILTIYGVKLGASRVVGIDIDPEAIQWAEKNIVLNNLSKKIELWLASIEKVNERFSVVTANLVLHVILDLIPHFNRVLIPGGQLILSGIVKDQVKKTKEALIGQGFQVNDLLLQEEWACVVAKNIRRD